MHTGRFPLRRILYINKMKKIVLCVIIIEKEQERSMYMKKRCLMGAILCCLGLALGSIHPVFAQADDGQNSARENYAAFLGGGDVGIIDVASEEKNAEVYVCGDAVEFSWMEWWYNWNIQNLGTEKNLEELFGYSGTTQGERGWNSTLLRVKLHRYGQLPSDGATAGRRRERAGEDWR